MDFESYLNYIEEAILVIDNSFDVISFNAAFAKLFPAARKSEYIGSCLEDCPELQTLAREKVDGREKSPARVVIGDKKYAVHISDFMDEKGKTVIARSFVLSDVTDYETLVEASETNNLMLQKSNEVIRSQKENLEIQTRLKERVAAGAEAGVILRDIHDTLGHSLTVLNCLNRLALIEHGNHETSREELEETIRLAKISLAELDTIDVLTLGGREKTMTITAFLYRLKQTMLGVSLEVRLAITGEETPRYEKLFYPLTRIVQEAATNCLRHANASELSIAIDFGQTLLSLEMEDNGTSLQGCSAPPKGNGLIGMERRVHDCGGEIKININKTGGVVLGMTLPV